MRKFLPFWWVLVFLTATVGLQAAPSIVVGSPGFEPAESGRKHMDVGGVWNGTSEVTNTTGDTFSITYKNTSDDIAYDFGVNVTLPSGFVYVASTATVSTSPASSATVSATVVGNVLSLNTGGYDLPGKASITYKFGLYVDTSVDSGTYQLQYRRSYALVDGGASVIAPPTQQNVLVTEGETTVNITPKQQKGTVGGTVQFSITIRNTGIGGLFDVAMDETEIYPSGNNLEFIGMSQTGPARAAAISNEGSIITLGYLKPGEVFSADVTATVLSCGSIVNKVTSINRARTIPVVDSAPVQIDFLQPLVSYTAPHVVLDYNLTKPVTIQIDNNGMGSAYNFRLETTLHNLDVTVADVSPDWSYSSGTGLFIYNGNGGTIANNDSALLEYTLKANDACTPSGFGQVDYNAFYENGCGDLYSVPQNVGSVSSPDNAPSVHLNQTVSVNRIAVGNGAFYELTLSAANPENIASGNVVVTSELASEIEWDNGPGKNLSPSVGTAVYDAGLHVVTWTVPTSNLTQDRKLKIDFIVLPEPCNAGTMITTTSATSVTTSQSCTVSGNTETSFFASNNPGLLATQYFDVTPLNGGTIFQTGNEIGPGQGDLIEFTANYEFGSGYPGTWTDSVYDDKFGGVSTMKLVPGSLTVSGTFGTVSVPPSAITLLSPGIEIDLRFLALGGYFSDDNVSGRAVTFRYKATVPDASLTGDSTRAVTQINNLFLANAAGAGGICNDPLRNRFTQGVFYTLARANAQISLAMPAVLEVCKPELLTITVRNGNAKDAHNVRATLLTGGSDFIYDTSFSPVYSGVFSTGNITYQSNGGIDPTFIFTGGALTGEGTIQVRVWRENAVMSSLEATVDFDSLQTAASVNRVYDNDTSYTPSRIHKANLAITVTPGSLSVTGTKITYVTYVTNTDAGKAYGATLTNSLPPGITINIAETNAANAGPPGYPVDVIGQDLEWQLGNIASGTTISITLVADVGIVPGCEIAITTERIVASWGCGEDTGQRIERKPPSFSFPSGKMQVVHDTSQTVARLCDPGRVVIIVKNTGPTNILGVIVKEIMPPASSLSIAGTVQYRVNGGALKDVTGVPSGDGSAGNPYTWTSSQISELSELVPVGVTGPNEIRIEFDLASTEDLASLSPVLQASASATISCGRAVTSPAQPFTIPVERPEITIRKTGLNITADPSGTPGKIVYGGAGDVVEWDIEIENRGNAIANNLRLSDLLSGSSGTATITGPGHNGGTLLTTSGQVIALPDLNHGETVIYTITEVLGNSCVTKDVPANVTWGCVNNGLSVHSNVSEPGKSNDSARIVMDPEIQSATDIDQKIEYLHNGRAKIEVTITNNGGNAHALKLTNIFPNMGADMVFDSSVPVAWEDHESTHYPTLTSSISGVFHSNSSITSPEFTFTNGNPTTPMLRYGDRVKITYYVRPTVLDTTMATTFPSLAEPDKEGSLDPNPPRDGKNWVRLYYKNSCGATFDHSQDHPIALQSPNLNITEVGPNANGNTLLTDTTSSVNFTFIIKNEGKPDSIANFISTGFPDLGSGWTVNSVELITPGTGTTTLAGGQTSFSPAQFGTLSEGQSATIRIAVTPNKPGPLTLKLQVRGEAREAGKQTVTTSNYYSLDQRAQRVIGITLSKDLTDTSETTSTGSNVQIGEEITFTLKAAFFGAEADITDLTIRDTPVATGGSARYSNLGYVSHAFTPNNTFTPDVTPPTPVTVPSNTASSRIDFTKAILSETDINAGNGIFETDLTFRVLNVPANAHNRAIRNNLGVQFTYLGQSFRSSDGADGFSGGVALGDLHKHPSNVTVRRPTATIVKTVRNITKGGSFAATVEAEGDDEVEYRLIVTNSGASNATPLFSLVVEDDLPTGLILMDSLAGADTDNNGTADVLTTGITSGDGQIITFNAANTPIGIAGRDLVQLDRTRSVTLLYRATVAQSVNPSQLLVNSAEVTAYTLPHPSGNQTAPLGIPGNTDGAAIITKEVTTPANVRIKSIAQVKTIEETSEVGSVGDVVLVGEQVRYLVALELPLGTIPDLSVTDTLPVGMTFIGTPVIVVGSDVVIENDPVGFTQNGQELNWSFGEAVVNGSNRTVTIDYVGQVENIAANKAGEPGDPGKKLINSAAYTFTGLPNDVNNLANKTVTVAEPRITVKQEVRNPTIDSGPYFSSIDSTHPSAPEANDILEYQITISNSNAANSADGYDFNISATLPEGVTYLGGWTGVDSGGGSVVPTGFQPGDPEIAMVGGRQILTWGREQGAEVNFDIPAGATFTFHYRAQIQNTSNPKPLQLYSNELEVDWSSLDGDPVNHGDLGVAHGAAGDPMGERIYSVEKITDVWAANKTKIVKTKIGDTLPLDAPVDGFRIGDVVTYTLTIDVQEAVLDGFVVQDLLPTGLAFLETVSVAPASGNDGFTYTMPVAGSTASAENVGVIGALTWDFGDLVNVGDDLENDTLTIEYMARVLDSGGVAVPPSRDKTTETPENSATVSFKLHDASEFSTEAAKLKINVEQPFLTIEKTRQLPAAYNVARPGAPVTFQLKITNDGTAPAYNVELEDLIPEGMRDTTPVLIAATLNGDNILAEVNQPTWVPGTGSWSFDLLDVQFVTPATAELWIGPGQSLVVVYKVVLDEDAPKGSTLTNQATVKKYFSKPLGELTERREYVALAPVEQDIIVGMEITGFVYQDINTNGTRDDFEDWIAGANTFVNLVDLGTSAVIRSTGVAPGEGNYLLTDIPPGNYRIVVSDTAVGTVGKAPTSWIFRSPPNGARPVVLTVADRHTENFGLYLGVTVAGQVFRDDGAGSGIANNGRRTGGEVGLSGVVVRLTNGGGTVYDTSATMIDGKFQLFIPDSVANGSPLQVEAVRPSAHLATGGYGAGGVATYDRTGPSLAFTHVAGQSVLDIEIGFVPENALQNDGQQTILPGTTTFYQHLFTAGSGGTVEFSVAGSASPAIPWSTIIIRDINGNGLPDAGEPVITDTVLTVVAGEEIQLLVKESSPLGSPYGATKMATITATFTYTNATPALVDVRTRQDITTVSETPDASLQLVKEVDTATALPGAEITYTITYRNLGNEALQNLVINDRTPHYTVLVSTGNGPLGAGLTGVSLVLEPAVGAAGPIQWTFDGELDPGASGTVTFKVKLAH